MKEFPYVSWNSPVHEGNQRESVFSVSKAREVEVSIPLDPRLLHEDASNQHSSKAFIPEKKLIGGGAGIWVPC